MSLSDIVIPDLKGLAVLITGASTGIGAALARAFAGQGCMVGLHYNSSAEAAHAVAKEIEDAGGNVFVVKGDATKSDEMRRVVDETARTFGRLDGLINNAGGMVARVLYENMSDEHYDAVMDLNARSVLAASHAALPHLKKQGGFIIHTSSVAARTGGTAGSGPYGSSKAFVEAVGKGMALEFGKYGIRVNSVAPGYIATPFQDRYALPGQEQQVAKAVPLGRVGTAEDCVGTFLFLASNTLSGYITGQMIDVNGGQLMP
ncbi:SDR family NAD(P)-dependent oxidoreductase [Rhizobium sp. LjRoot254]|uniref:SDR family NAD(P)-dependent oxidoreductase n=1 Tax=Rhizobium sp. LjRoot254 TaxID=3342297 RepID=UPI003ECFF0C4